MNYRKLRIVWSVGCGVVCLLLIASCLISYWRFDQVLEPISSIEYVGFTSAVGEVRIGRSNDQVLRRLFSNDFAHRGFPLSVWETGPRGGPFFPASVPEPADRRLVTLPRVNLDYGVRPVGVTHDELIVPYWFPIAITAMLTAAPWLHWRFSLRTLLIAATLVAVGLGLAVMMLRGS
jgi:hypothetical protein